MGIWHHCKLLLGNYRELKLTDHILKIVDRVIEKILKVTEKATGGH